WSARAYLWVALRPAPRAPRTRSSPELRAPTWAGQQVQALLFVAVATLENGSPVTVTSQRSGLPAPWHPDAIQTLSTAPAPAPDMTSQWFQQQTYHCKKGENWHCRVPTARAPAL